MNIILTLASILIFALSLLPSELSAAANTYYVTQSGRGDRSGESSGNAWSVSDFNRSANWSDVDNIKKIDPGDTVYFSGPINSELAPKGSGIPGQYITLDGYEIGDCNAISESCAGQAAITRSQALGQFGIALWDSSYGLENGKDYIIIQDFEIKEAALGIYGAEGCDHIIIRRNFIHDILHHGIVFTTGRSALGGFQHGSSYITIGGGLGDGNVVKDSGSTTAGTDVNLNFSHDIIVSYNHLYATKNNGNAGDRGIDGIVLNHGSYRALIEFNSIHSHNDSYGHDAKGEDGIDIKDDDRVGGCHDIIIRYNHIYDHQYQSNIVLQSVTHKVYVYGNRLHNSNWGGLYIKEGAGGTTEPVSHVYAFSNLIYGERDAGSRVHSDSGGTDEKHHDIYYWNNTFAENGIDNHGKSFTHITADINPSSVSIFNNIFYMSRPGYSKLQERQVHLSSGLINSDYNRYYWPGKTSQLCINGEHANAIGGYVNSENNSSEGDPGLVDIAGNDYRIASNKSAVFGAGKDLGNSTIAKIAIQGVVYPVYKDVALGPDTDWSGIIPIVEVLRRSIVGWDIGAYAYVTKNFSTNKNLHAPTGLEIIVKHRK